MTEGGVIEIVTTFPDVGTAEECAHRLVSGRLAACVQVEGPVRSVYSWGGRVERSEEWRCTCKTSPGGRAACVDAILGLHPYDLPQIVVRACDASAGYADWVARSTDPGGR